MSNMFPKDHDSVHAQASHKLVLEARLINADNKSPIFDAKPGDQFLIDSSEHVHVGESLKVMSYPLSEYTMTAVYTVELQDVPAECPFIKYPPIRFVPGKEQGVLQCVHIHVTP